MFLTMMSTGSGQNTQTLNMRRIMDGRKILLVKLKAGAEFVIPRTVRGRAIFCIGKCRQSQLIDSKRIVGRDGGGEETFADISVRPRQGAGDALS